MNQPDIPFLTGLEPAAAAAVRARFVSVAVAGGRTLFEEGEIGEALYTVVSGAVGLSVHDADSGETRRLARLGPPETFGEMALLSSEPRSATATVLRDTHLLRLSREAFEEVVEAHPGTLRYFARQLSSRLAAAYNRRNFGHAPRSFAVLAVTPGPDAVLFGRLLAAALDATLTGRTGCLTEWPDGADEGWFHDYETRHARTLFVASEVDCPWCRLCLRHADHVLLLASPGEPLRPGARACVERVCSDWIRLDLVVRQEPDAALPRPLHPDAAALPARMRLHIRSRNTGDYARVSRLISGAARGLVLGGGGARAYAHIGVLQALEEAGVPVDLVGGTSMGGILAASLAKGMSAEAIRADTAALLVRHNPLNDYTLPFHALLRGAKTDAVLEERFGGARVEDLWLPFYCVSSNLSSATAMVHERGPLPQALRASSAIPGLLPPVVCPDGVLVDGGMMNNLPSDVMAGLERGPVLAVDVGSDRAFHDMPKRSWPGHMIRRLLGQPDAMPSIVPLLLRAATVSSAAQAAMATNTATVVLKPPLAGVDLRAWSNFEATAETGYRHTRDAIAAGKLEGWI